MKQDLRLLICVQAVDVDDRLMGFFVEWLQEAAKVFTELHVMALRVGRYELPPNVFVYQLRQQKESQSKLEVVWNILRRSWQLRRRYDAVFVRGDAIYVLLFSWLWRAMRKPVVLWYAHYKANKLIPWANRFATAIVTSVPEACAYPGVRPIAIGQAINHERFTYQQRSFDKPFRAVSLGRVLPIKGIKDIVVDLQQANLLDQYHLDIVGPSLDMAYEKDIDSLLTSEKRIHWNKAGISYDEVPHLLKEHDVLINAYPGSLDKVIVESMLAGVIPVFATSALNDTLPADYQWLYTPTSETRRATLQRLAQMSVQELQTCAQVLYEFALRDHSLASQMKRLRDVIQKFL